VGFSRLSQSGVVARLLIGALGSGALLLVGSAPASAHAMTPAALQLAPCQLGAPSMPPCYGPGQIRAAYDVPSDVTGAGRTIVIIGAFHSPAVATDLAAFDGIWGLADANLTVVAPFGFPPPAKSQATWLSEQSIDVEWAHAIAPGAALVLVQAKSSADDDILNATKYAIDNNLGDVIAMSFSEAERCPSKAFLADQHTAFGLATDKGITLVAAAGDTGAAQPTCNGSLVPGVGTPASDPLVTAAGGTELTADLASGAYGSEVAWSRSGGGFSAAYRRPGYQARTIEDNGHRGVPDVAWSASGVGESVVRINGHNGAVGGTSVATAAWAGVAALADEAAGHRIGVLNHALYQLFMSADAAEMFHDIGSGSNGFAGLAGFSATAGWDPVTGLGTPDVANLVSAIAARASGD
jgi:subtilase family serine protease